VVGVGRVIKGGSEGAAQGREGRRPGVGYPISHDNQGVPKRKK